MATTMEVNKFSLYRFSLLSQIGKLRPSPCDQDNDAAVPVSVPILPTLSFFFFLKGPS